MENSERPLIALTTGDPGGIGPEICLKAALSDEVRSLCRPVLFGDPMVIETHIESTGLSCEIDVYDEVAQVDHRAPAVAVVGLDQFSDAPFVMGEINPQNGAASVDTCVAAIHAALDDQVSAVVAAPNTKLSIVQAGIDYDGFLSLVARETGLSQEDIFMMLSFGETNIAHCTLHSSVRRSLELITKDRVMTVIRAVHQTLVETGRDDPIILVSGLNPHASEDGLFGDEEKEIITPALDAVRAEGIKAEGPVPADLMLHRTDVDAFIVMLHDQGHIPAKLITPHGAAGVIIGGPILFSSVGHGSALDIAGQGTADPAAMVEAIRWIAG